MEKKELDMVEELSAVMTEEDAAKLQEDLKPEVPQITQEERLQLLHSKWKAKQDLVPESPGDWFNFRSKDGKSEIRLTREQLGDLQHDITKTHDLMSVVKLSLGEAEKSAK